MEGEQVTGDEDKSKDGWRKLSVRKAPNLEDE
jgi:hypothetical protein